MTNTDAVAVAAPTIASLLTANAVRTRARMIFDAGLRGDLAHFALKLDRLPTCAAYVAETIRQNYPTLKVPPHSRWRHFKIGDFDRWKNARPQIVSNDPVERLKPAFALVIVSVLLDAGAGPQWRWNELFLRQSLHDNGAIYLTRSEGLAWASINAWACRTFTTENSFRNGGVNASGLIALDGAKLGAAFQVGPDNPLEGLDGRVALLNRLGAQITARPDLFGAGGQLGALSDTLIARANGKHIDARNILNLVLEALGPIWPARLTVDGISLGDTWRHPAIQVDGTTDGLMPFHKLSQWLTYSLIEPLEEAGFTVTDQDALTGLAEYRNGGLFIDMGVIVPRDPALPTMPLTPDQEPIVEWRALTVALLDEIAPLVRTELGVTAQQMPLASILEGGTWSAGRRIAKTKRRDGSPPLTIISDGTVF